MLVCGTGAGVLPMFLRKNFATYLNSLVTVDINESMLQVAERFFGFEANDSEGIIKSNCADAYDFIEGAQPNSFDAIFMDVNFEENNIKISPPTRFLEVAFLQKIVDSVRDNGYVAINLLIEDKADLENVFNNAKQVNGVRRFTLKAEEDVNVILMFAKGESGKVPCPDGTKSPEKRIAGFNNLVKKFDLSKATQGVVKYVEHVENMKELKK
jgi:spermidine synthase